MNRHRFDSLRAGLTMMSVERDRRQLELLLLQLLAHRASAESLCPTEVARAASPESWQLLMPAVRLAALRLAGEGLVELTLHGRVVQVDQAWRGPVQLRRGQGWRAVSAWPVTEQTIA